MTVEIREATPDDYPAIGQLLVRAYVATGSPSPDDNPYIRSLGEVASHEDDGVLVVATVDGVVAGTVTWCPVGAGGREMGTDTEGELRRMAVHPDFQRRGIGRQLVDECLTRGRASGYEAAVLCSASYMTAAHRLYESMGFQRIPDRDSIPEPGVYLRAYRIVL